MDPTAQKDSQNQTQTPNPIKPGQFVISGEPSITPTQNPTPKLATNISPNPPAQNQSTAPATNPDELLASLTKEDQSKVIAQDVPAPTLPPIQSTPQGDANNSTQSLPSLNLAQVEVPLETQSLPPAENLSPDPTPFIAPQAAPPSEQGSQGMDKIKMILIFLGAAVLVALVAFLVWFFILNKSQKAAKTENNSDAGIEEPSPLPKRTQGGFGDLPQSTISSTPASSPIVSPSSSDEITVPDLTGL